MRDKWLLGVISGSLAGIIVGVLGTVAESIGLMQKSFVSALGEILVFSSGGFSALTIGWLVHLILAGLFGTAFIYLLSWSRYNYPYLKGMFFGLTLWTGSYLISGLVSGQRTLIGQDAASWLTYLILNLTYGLFLVFFTLTLGQETTASV